MHKSPFEHQSIWIHVLPFSMLLIVLELSFVQIPISVIVHSLSMHFVIEKLTFIELAVCPFIPSSPVHFAFSPLPSVVWPIWMSHLTQPISKPIFEQSFIDLSRRKYQPPFSMIFVILPLSLVLFAICMYVNSQSLCLFIHKFSFENVPIWMPKSAKSVNKVIVELSNVLCSIWPGLNTPTMP